MRGVWVSYEEKNRETGCGVEGMRIKSSGERGLLTPISVILKLFEVLLDNELYHSIDFYFLSPLLFLGIELLLQFP